MHAAGTDAVRLVEHRAGRVAVYLNPRLAEAVPCEELLRLPEALAGLPGRPTRQRGRPTSWRWRPAWCEGDGLAVRLYAHGGVLGPVLGTRFWGARRMLDELRLAIVAHELGVPTAVPVAVRIERTFGPLVTAHYVSEAIPDAVDLLTLLRDAGRGGPVPPAARRRLAESLADAVAAMHDAGIWHADLSLGNLLVQGALDAPRTFIIDFDRAKRTESVPLPRRVANLLRLNRSVTKWAASRQAVGLRDRVRFLRAYFGRYPEWRTEWRRIVAQHGNR